MGSVDGLMRIWNISNENITNSRHFQFPNNLPISSVAISYASDKIAVGSSGGIAYLLPFDFDKSTTPIEIIQDGNCLDISFSADSNKVATIFSQKSINSARVWNTQNGYPITGALENGTGISKILFSNNDNQIIAWPDSTNDGNPGIASIWDIVSVKDMKSTNEFLKIAKN